MDSPLTPSPHSHLSPKPFPVPPYRGGEYGNETGTVRERGNENALSRTFLRERNGNGGNGQGTVRERSQKRPKSPEKERGDEVRCRQVKSRERLEKQERGLSCSTQKKSVGLGVSRA